MIVLGYVKFILKNKTKSGRGIISDQQAQHGIISSQGGKEGIFDCKLYWYPWLYKPILSFVDLKILKTANGSAKTE